MLYRHQAVVYYVLNRCLEHKGRIQGSMQRQALQYRRIVS